MFQDMLVDASALSVVLNINYSLEAKTEQLRFSAFLILLHKSPLALEA